MWSLGSELRLDFNKSLSYQKCLIGLFTLASMLVIQSSLGRFEQGIMLIALICYGQKMISHAIPTGRPLRLFYQGRTWIIEEATGDLETYDTLTILLKSGLFMLLKLSGGNCLRSCTTPTSHGLSAGSRHLSTSLDLADKPQDVGCVRAVTSAGNKQRCIVIFRDQLTDDEMRQLKWVLLTCVIF